MDEAIIWLSRNNGKIIDFGCGNGRILFAALLSGASYISGIDISPEAINIAQKIAKKYNLTKKCHFINGGVNRLHNFKNNSFDGAILFNIIDNLYPSDTINLIKYIDYILKPGASLLIKLNPFINKQEIKNNSEYIFISENFYKETSGLFLYNISNELVTSMLTGFKLKKQVDVYFKEYNLSNRLFYFIKK